MSPSACVSKPVTPICLVARRVSPRGRASQLFRSKTHFLLFSFSAVILRPPSDSISTRFVHASPDTNVSRVIGIFETAVCHCHRVYHPPTIPRIWIHPVRIQILSDVCIVSQRYACLPLYFLPPLFFFPSLSLSARKFAKPSDFERNRNDIVPSPPPLYE